MAYRLGNRLLPVYSRVSGALRGRGLGRIGPLHLTHEWLLAKLNEGLVDVQGHKMLLDPIDTLGLSVRDVWEPLETKVVQNEVRRGSVVLDIGAHIGYYTLMMARLVGSRGRVFAFEPNPANYDLLRRNIQINSYRNVTAVNRAVSDMQTKTRLHLSEDNSGDHRIYDSKDGRRSVEVRSIGLNSYFRRYTRRIDFIKMDIQGAEPGAIRGMSSLLQSHHPRMVVEFWPFGLTRFGVSGMEFLELLMSFDYELFEVDERTSSIEPAAINALVAAYDPDDEFRHTNLLCVPGAA